jgi:N-acetyl-gamma-glutamylphosphate reductase
LRLPSVSRSRSLGAREGDHARAPELPVDEPLEPARLGRVARSATASSCARRTRVGELAARAAGLGVKVVDLSADFRLPDARLYERTYEHRHPAPELLSQAPYGLTELAREQVRGASLVANPGCYPTATLLALQPLVKAGLVDTRYTVVVDAKSGVSGAGKNASARTHFGATHENFLAYGVGGHRHAPEIAGTRASRTWSSSPTCCLFSAASWPRSTCGPPAARARRRCASACRRRTRASASSRSIDAGCPS